MENVVNEKHLWLSHIWTGCSQGTRLLIHSHNLQLRGKWWWTYWGGAPLRIMTFESCHLKFETWLGICGSLETPEPIWIWNLVSQIRQLIIIVRLKWQCWAIPQFQKHPQYHSFVVPPNSVAVGCQEDKVKGTAGPLFTTFHDHLTSCGPNDFDEFRKIYWFYWLRIPHQSRPETETLFRSFRHSGQCRGGCHQIHRFWEVQSYNVGPLDS